MTCVVIGGGVIGLSIAYRLAQEKYRVLVLDEHEIGSGPSRGASWAGAGILPAATLRNVDDPYERLRGLSHHLHAKWSSDLRQQTGIDTGFRQCGGWYVARTRAERATLIAQRDLWEEQGIEVRWGSRHDLLRSEPALESMTRQEIDIEGWFVPEDCQIRNPRHLQALQAACLNMGVELRSQHRVDRLVWDQERLLGLAVGDRTIQGEHYFFTAGAWTQQMLQWFGLRSGILPVRGQMLLYQTEPGWLKSIINEGHRYLVPREDGYLLAGSCEEEVGYVCETTEEQVAILKEWVCSILGRAWDLEPLRAWAGLRPGVFDGLPYLGRLSRHPQVWIAAGHFRSGLHLSCATAECLVRLFRGESSPCDLTPFRPDRYWQPSSPSIVSIAAISPER